MAQLTWRNVAAPDFGTALQGYRQFSSLLGDATEGLSKGLSVYDRDQTTQAQAAIAQEAMRIQDPAAYQAALASGQFTAGVNPRRVTPEFLATLQTGLGTRTDQATAMLNHQVTGENLDKTRYDNARVKGQNVNLDAAAPVLNQILTLRAQGRGAEADALAAANPQINNVTPGQLQSATTAGSNAATSAAALRGTNFDFGLRTRNDADAQAVQGVMSRLYESAIDPQSAREFAARELPKMSPTVQNSVRAQINAAFPGTFGADAVGGGVPGLLDDFLTKGGAGGTAFTSAIPFKETRDYVQTITGKAGNLTGTNEEKAAALVPLVLDKESKGQRYGKDGKLLEGPVTKDGTTAKGEMQVMDGTTSNPGYGVRPAANNSPEERARVGRDYLKAMLDKYNGDVPKALAAYNAGPGTVDGWLKSGQTPAGATDPTSRAIAAATTVDATQAAQIGLKDRQSQDLSTPVIAKLPKLRADTRADYEVIPDLVKAGGPLAGQDPARIKTMLRDVMQKTGQNAAVSAEILAASSADETWIQRIFKGTPTGWAVDKFGMGVGTTQLGGVSKDRLDSIVDYFREGKANDDLSRNQQDANTGTQQEAAIKLLSDVRTKINQVSGLVATQPGLQPTLDRLRAQEAQALLLAAAGNAKAGGRTPVAPAVQITNEERAKAAKAIADRATAAAAEVASRSPIDQQIMDAQNRAAALPLASPERAQILNQVRDLEMRRAAS